MFKRIFYSLQTDKTENGKSNIVRISLWILSTHIWVWIHRLKMLRKEVQPNPFIDDEEGCPHLW